jgi:TRAP-type C4-dicarboxylate transport system permease small subunit
MKKAFDTLADVLQTISGILFLFIFIIIVAGIICRTFLHTSLLWVDDANTLSVSWMLAFGMSVAVYRNAHLTMGFLTDRWPKSSRKVLSIALTLLAIGFFVMLVISGWQTVRMKMGLNFTVLGIPTGYAFLAIPVFGLLSGIFMTYRLLGLLNILHSNEEELKSQQSPEESC